MKTVFILNPNDPGVKHILKGLPDGLHVVLDRTAPIPERRGRPGGKKNRKLSDAQVVEARVALITGESYKRIAYRLKVGHRTVMRAIKGQGAYKK
jgi:hypothetical protein